MRPGRHPRRSRPRAASAAGKRSDARAAAPRTGCLSSVCRCRGCSSAAGAVCDHRSGRLSTRGAAGRWRGRSVLSMSRGWHLARHPPCVVYPSRFSERPDKGVQRDGTKPPEGTKGQRAVPSGARGWRLGATPLGSPAFPGTMPQAASTRGRRGARGHDDTRKPGPAQGSGTIPL